MAVETGSLLAFDTTACRQYGKGEQEWADDEEYHPVGSTLFRKPRFRSAYYSRSCTGREHPIVKGRQSFLDLSNKAGAMNCRLRLGYRRSDGIGTGEGVPRMREAINVKQDSKQCNYGDKRGRARAKRAGHNPEKSQYSDRMSHSAPIQAAFRRISISP